MNNMSEKEKYINLYLFSINYLDQITEGRIDLEKYFCADHKNLNSMKDVFVQFIYSAQNYQRMPNVIKFNERKDEIGIILHEFDIDAVSTMGFKELYYTFRDKFAVTSKDSNQNSWQKWSKSIVDSAKFLKVFKDVDDFKSFVNCFDYNVHTSMALPLLISEKISGIGFALACDLLKELGFSRYPKPDIHMKDVFVKLGLADDEPTAVFEAIVQMADLCKDVDEAVTPYKIDKIIWLICSGHFYMETPDLKIGSNKKEFIKLAGEHI